MIPVTCELSQSPPGCIIYLKKTKKRCKLIKFKIYEGNNAALAYCYSISNKWIERTLYTCIIDFIQVCDIHDWLFISYCNNIYVNNELRRKITFLLQHRALSKNMLAMLFIYNLSTVFLYYFTWIIIFIL